MSFILNMMHSVPGASAVEGYRAARRRHRHRLVSVGLVAILVFAVAAFTLPASAALVAVAGVVAVGLVAAFARPGDDERWLRGAAGERATAQILQSLPPRRWAVFHDLAVPGSRANIDHLVVGPTGVWVVDSKTTRGRVRFGWRSVRLGSRKLDPAVTRWEAEVVADRLGVPVRPIISVHGHGGRRRGGRAGRTRVVPATGLKPALKRGRRHLTRPEVAELADRVALVFGPAASHLVKGAARDG